MHEQKIRIILADDHPAVRAGIRQFLERDPAIQVVAEADDGEEALALIARFHPDVAALDMRMPRLSGLDVLRQLRAQHPDVRTVILTAYDDDPYIFAALRAGAQGYMLKTAGPDELIRAVRLVYAGRSALDSSVVGRVLEQLGQGGTGPQDQPERLTDRELDVLKGAARGLTNQAIGVELNISDRTVHSHLVNIFSKLGVNSRTEATTKAIRLGWLAVEDTAG